MLEHVEARKPMFWSKASPAKCYVRRSRVRRPGTVCSDPFLWQGTKPAHLPSCSTPMAIHEARSWSRGSDKCPRAVQVARVQARHTSLKPHLITLLMSWKLRDKTSKHTDSESVHVECVSDAAVMVHQQTLPGGIATLLTVLANLKSVKHEILHRANRAWGQQTRHRINATAKPLA